jgi:DNA invertase Pin-like site-specific DNA recombinase
MNDANRNAFQTVAVWKLDRFGRSLRHLVNALAGLEARGIAFVGPRQSRPLHSGRALMFQIIGAMAEFERTLITERVRAGLAVARAKQVLGPPRAGVDAGENCHPVRAMPLVAVRLQPTKKSVSAPCVGWPTSEPLRHGRSASRA